MREKGQHKLDHNETVKEKRLSRVDFFRGSVIVIELTSLVFSWMSTMELPQSLRWDLMKRSILGKSCSLVMVGLTSESRAPLMYLWVEPWTAAMLHFPRMSSMDCG